VDRVLDSCVAEEGHSLFHGVRQLVGYKEKSLNYCRQNYFKFSYIDVQNFSDLFSWQNLLVV
jgi:hypothetical protein